MINRYAKSLFITIFLYTILIVSFFVAIKTTDNIQNDNTISITVVSEIQSKEFEKIEQPQKLKKIVKKEKYIEKKEDAANKTVEKHSIIKPNQQSIENKKPTTSNQRSKIKHQEEQPSLSSDSIKNNFLARVKSAINANKHYPTLAKTREIEGKVHATFTINSNGSVSNIVILEGNNILKDATRKAIERSFPVEISNEIKNSMPFNENITLNFKLIEA